MTAIAIVLSVFFSACMTAIIMNIVIARVEQRLARLERRQRLLTIITKDRQTADR